jgi:hypothetical protein
VYAAALRVLAADTAATVINSTVTIDNSKIVECRLLGYKTPVRTSHETHYFPATEPSRLMLVGFEVFMAVTMKNEVLWDNKT